MPKTNSNAPRQDQHQILDQNFSSRFMLTQIYIDTLQHSGHMHVATDKLVKISVRESGIAGSSLSRVTMLRLKVRDTKFWRHFLLVHNTKIWYLLLNYGLKTDSQDFEKSPEMQMFYLRKEESMDEKISQLQSLQTLRTLI